MGKGYNIPRPRDIEDYVKDIIRLGEKLDWFVTLLKDVKIESYIYSKANKVINIDEGCLKLFQNLVYNDEEYVIEHEKLKEQLKEVIIKVLEIPDTITIEIDWELAF